MNANHRMPRKKKKKFKKMWNAWCDEAVLSFTLNPEFTGFALPTPTTESTEFNVKGCQVVKGLEIKF